MVPLARSVTSGVFLAGVSLFLVSCTAPKPPEIPEGVQTVTGELRRAELSLVRRGTHILSQRGQDLYLVESKTVNLQAHEGKEVTVRGMLQHNLDPLDPPVLVIESVEETGESLKTWRSPLLRIAFDAPALWEGSVEGMRIELLMPDAGSPILVVEKQDSEGKTFAEFSETFGDAIPVVVGQKRGIRIFNEKAGGQIVYIDRGSDIVAMHFTPPADASADIPAAFPGILRSVLFDELPRAQFKTGTGGTAGQPCGGSAGILCPAGQYCEVTDRATNIGRCVRY